jgi:hypothetical protein
LSNLVVTKTTTAHDQSRKGAKRAKVTGRRSSSRANARDLKKIFPFGRNDKEFFFALVASWRENKTLWAAGES